jgi:2-dehydro-3-deoxygluconokinase
MMRALCIGECMIELRAIDDSTMRVGHAGDTYNTAVYLRRTAAALGVEIKVGYLTGLGTDEFSTEMRQAWKREGVEDRSIQIDGSLPGLYTVRVDDFGERRFAYWRAQSAAARLFAGVDWISHLNGFDMLHLSGVTLQIASHEARMSLVDRLSDLRAGGTLISFDTNYRSKGWTDSLQAIEAMDAVSSVSTVVLATLDDEAALHGCQSVGDAAQRLRALGVPEVVVKAGAQGALVLANDCAAEIPARRVENVVDTTSAGDAFAGGYLASRMAGRGSVEAARVGAEVAATVVSHPGAIIPDSVPVF